MTGTSLRRPRTTLRSLGAAALAGAGLIALASASPAGAAVSTQKVELGRGVLASPAAAWHATAVPVGSVLIDLTTRSGDPIQTYGSAYSSDMAPRGMRATGYRPQGLPTRHALVSGSAGRSIRKVRVHFAGGSRKTVRTVPAPRDWELSARFFVTGATVPASLRNRMRVVRLIEGLSGSGRVIKRLRNVPTGAY